MTAAILMGAGDGAYTARAVNFDGSTYLSKSGDLSGNSDSKVLWVSGYLKPGLAGTQRIYQASTSSVVYVDVYAQSSGTLSIIARNAAGTEILDANFASMFTASTWGLFAVCIDLANASNRSAVNSSGAVSGSYGTYTNDTINFTNTDHAMFATVAGSSIYTGDGADVIVSFGGSYIDPNDSNVYARLIKDSKPVDPRDNGSYPTGSQPIIYTGLRSTAAASTFGTNKGSGGGFTTTGTLTEAATSPSD